MFSERIRRRHALFWNTRRLGFHGKGRCLLTYLSRHDPLETWHCCDLWQRKLANKWNSREFAVKFGCGVPELYWSGRDVGSIPFERLPDRYVVRPVVGHSKRGIFVMANGIDLISGRQLVPRQIVAETKRALPPWTRRRVLVEEYVAPEEASLGRPLEVKCWTFGGRLAAFQTTRRPASPNEGWTHSTRFFDEQWGPLPELHSSSRGHRILPAPEAPRCSEEIRSRAEALGRAYETFVRIDFYASAAGAVFSEFAPTPLAGNGFTEFGERYLEEIWRETIPDRI